MDPIAAAEVWVLLTINYFGFIWGPVGMMIGVPILSVLKLAGLWSRVMLPHSSVGCRLWQCNAQRKSRLATMNGVSLRIGVPIAPNETMNFGSIWYLVVFKHHMFISICLSSTVLSHCSSASRFAKSCSGRAQRCRPLSLIQRRMT